MKRAKLILSVIKDRRGISNTAVISIIGLVIMPLTVGLVYFSDLFEHEIGEKVGSPGIMSTHAEYEVVYLSDALEDLEKLGCMIVNVSEVEDGARPCGFLLEYKEFRKVALKQKIVFLLYNNEYEDYSILTTSFENFVVVWTPHRFAPN